MPRKALFMGISVIVLALAMMGAAFATGMDFSNIGALSGGKADLTQINTDHVGFISSADGCGVDRVVLSFDRDLTAGSTIWVMVADDEHIIGIKILGSFLSKDDEVVVILNELLTLKDICDSTKIAVAVAER